MALGLKLHNFGPNVMPEVRWCPVGASKTIRENELLGRINAASTTPASLKVFASVAEVTAAGGMLGLAMASVKTGSDGLTTTNPPANVAAGAYATYPLNGYADGFPGDPDGNVMIPVALFNPRQLVRAIYAPATAAVADSRLIGLQAGLLLGVDSGLYNGQFVIDTAASVPLFTIVGINERDANYNVSCHGDPGASSAGVGCEVILRPLASVCSDLAGTYYAS